MAQARRETDQLADWGSRAGAALLDAAIVVAIVIAAVILTVGTALSLLLAPLMVAAYYVGTMARPGLHNGQTIGKQTLDIRVVRDDGRPVTAGTALARDVALKLVAGGVTFGLASLIDCLWPLGERRKRALHDLAVDTHVVRTRPVVRKEIPAPAPPRPRLSPPIARHLDAAYRIQHGIGAAVQRSQLPYGDVSREVGALVGQLQQSALNAQSLYETLWDSPVAEIERRLQVLAGGQRPELAEALREQLVVQRRIEAQFERYDAELERIVVELDTIRAHVVSACASGDALHQERLADAVRALRDEMHAVAEGINRAYG